MSKRDFGKPDIYTKDADGKWVNLGKVTEVFLGVDFALSPDTMVYAVYEEGKLVRSGGWDILTEKDKDFLRQRGWISKPEPNENGAGVQ